MLNKLMAAFFAFLCGTASAQSLTAAQLKERNLHPLSQVQVQALLAPGVWVKYVTAKESTRRYLIQGTSTFAVSSDGAGQSGVSTVGNGGGTFSVSDKGKWCAVTKWSLGNQEDWCRFLYPAETPNTYYLASEASVKRGDNTNLIVLTFTPSSF